jgi:HIV Tat-specific factor 1
MTTSEGNASVGKTSRVVVLTHMFTLQELEEDASLLLDLKEEVREECSTLGEVTNVVLYDVRH